MCVHIVKVRVRVGDLSPCPRGPGLEKEERKGQGGAADARPGMGARVVTSDPLEVPNHRGRLGPWPPPTCRAPGPFLAALAVRSPGTCLDQLCVQGREVAVLRKALSGVLSPEGWLKQEVTVMLCVSSPSAACLAWCAPGDGDLGRVMNGVRS